MEIEQEQQLENHLSLMVKISGWFQLTAAATAIFIMAKQPKHYKVIGEALSIGALISSHIISRFYISFGKKLENLKTFSVKEREFRKREYFRRFFAFYPMWILFMILFSKV